MNLEQARTNMVEQQIRTWEVLDQDVLDLLYVVPREAFVPEKHRALAFSDLEIPIGEGQRMWQPKLEARVLQELNVRKADRVLEVGTGSGYFTALLSHRAAQVVSVEINPALAAFGRANLERHGADNVTLEIGDAARGWPAHAPYDVDRAHRLDAASAAELRRAARAGRQAVRRGRRGAGDDRPHRGVERDRLALEQSVRDRDPSARQRRAPLAF